MIIIVFFLEIIFILTLFHLNSSLYLVNTLIQAAKIVKIQIDLQLSIFNKTFLHLLTAVT